MRWTVLGSTVHVVDGAGAPTSFRGSQQTTRVHTTSIVLGRVAL